LRRSNFLKKRKSTRLWCRGNSYADLTTPALSNLTLLLQIPRSFIFFCSIVRADSLKTFCRCIMAGLISTL
jgi:hypothetical protein